MSYSADATAVKMMSMQLSMAILDPIAPLLIVSSGEEMHSETSALFAIPFFLSFDITMVEAFIFIAVLNALTISFVVPEYDRNIATSFSQRIDAFCLISCESVRAHAFLLILMNFC